MKCISILTKILLLAVLTTAFVACSKTSHKAQPQGGQDSGGGNTTVSSIEDVELYFKRVDRILNVILTVFFDDKNISKFQNNEKRKLLNNAKNKIFTLLKLEPDIKNVEYISYNNFLDFVAMFPVKINKESSCSSVDKKHASASINKLAPGSTICISFKELQKIPRSSLEREISGLILHELMHGIGFDEETAAEIQMSLINNFDKIFPSGLRIFIKNEEQKSTIEGTLGFFMEDIISDSIDSHFLNMLTHPPSTSTVIVKNEWDYLCNEHIFVAGLAETRKENLYKVSRLESVLLDSKQVTINELDNHFWILDELIEGTGNLNKKLSFLCSKQQNQTLTEEMRETMQLIAKNLNLFKESVEKYEHLMSAYE